MPFIGHIRVGPGNLVLNGGLGPPRQGAILCGRGGFTLDQMRLSAEVDVVTKVCVCVCVCVAVRPL